MVGNPEVKTTKYTGIKVSAIIPIYNVERFIVRCAESLMRQSLDEVEFIFVNDATPDGSMKRLYEVLELYPQRRPYVKIIHHETNCGLPAARNSGLRVAVGKYIFHCDGDDFLEPNTLKRLYEAAQHTEADYVWSDYTITSKEGDIYKKQNSYSDADQALRAMLRGDLVFNVWNKLVRRDLYLNQGITFYSGHSMGEDMTMIMLLAHAEKIAYIDYSGYHYIVANPTSLTKKAFSERNLQDLKCNISRTIEFIEKRFGRKYEFETNCFKLNQKWTLLAFSSKIKHYRLWYDWFPEANAYIFSQCNISLRIKIVEWCASRKLYWLVKLHYLLVIKCFYKIIGK